MSASSDIDLYALATRVMEKIAITDPERRSFDFANEYHEDSDVPLFLNFAKLDREGRRIVARKLASARAASDLPAWILTGENVPWESPERAIAVFRAAASDMAEGLKELARENKVQAATAKFVTNELAKLAGRELLDAGANAAFLEEFDALFVPRDALDSLEQPEPLIQGVMDAASFGLLVAQSGSFKSFLALAWACSVATGTAWLGRDVAAGPVIYCAGEGIQGVAKRVQAWEEHNGSRAAALTVFTRAFDIGIENGAALTAFIDRVRIAPPKLIVFDTLNRYAQGHDESAAQDMSVVNGNVAKIIEATGAHVLLVHHTTKAGDKTGRGSGSLFAAVDQAWAIVREGKSHEIVLETTKSKNDAPAEDLALRLEPVGESLVVVASDPIDAFDEIAAADDEALHAALVANPGLAQSRYYESPSSKNKRADVRPKGIRSEARIRAARDRLIQQGRAHYVSVQNGRQLHPGPAPSDGTGFAPVPEAPQ